MTNRALLHDPHLIRSIAVEAVISEPTIRKFLRGDPVRPVCRIRIERALVSLGLAQRRMRAAR